jgi:hypothetical protein
MTQPLLFKLDPEVVATTKQKLATTSPTTRRLFDGAVSENDVVDITRDLIQKISSQLDEEMSKWVYDQTLFTMARENYNVSPAMIPMLWRVLPRKFMSYDYFLHCFAACGGKVDVPSGKNADDYLIARTYQTYCGGFLRELDLCRNVLAMNHNLQIKKFIKEDLAGGDLLFIDPTRHTKELWIAVKHDGETSRRYNLIKKDGKEIGLRKFTAFGGCNNKRVHTIGHDQIVLLFETWH